MSAKYCERTRARKLMAELERQGHRITVDWTNHTKEDTESLREYAIEDIKGATRAKVSIFIMERYHKYKGCWVEMGAALAKGRRVIILGKAGNSCVFVNHPKVMLLSGIEGFLKMPLKSWLKGSTTAEEYIDSHPDWGKLPFTDIGEVPYRYDEEMIHGEHIDDVEVRSNLREMAENDKT